MLGRGQAGTRIDGAKRRSAGALAKLSAVDGRPCCPCCIPGAATAGPRYRRVGPRFCGEKIGTKFGECRRYFFQAHRVVGRQMSSVGGEDVDDARVDTFFKAVELGGDITGCTESRLGAVGRQRTSPGRPISTRVARLHWPIRGPEQVALYRDRPRARNQGVCGVIDRAREIEFRDFRQNGCGARKFVDMREGHC